MTETPRLLPIGTKDRLDPADRVEPSAKLIAASRPFLGRLDADDGHRFVRHRLLRGARHDAKFVDTPEPAVMGHRRIEKGDVENLGCFGKACIRFLDAEADARRFLWDATGRAYIEPPTSQLVEHANLFHNPPGLIVGKHNAHDAETKRPRHGCDMCNEQTLGRTEAEPEMVFVEEDALEARKFVDVQNIRFPPEGDAQRHWNLTDGDSGTTSIQIFERTMGVDKWL